jgi:formimidoylglutamate deiminase
MNLRGTWIEADLTWQDGQFVPGIKVEIRNDGTIGKVLAPEQDPDSRAPLTRLRGKALLPGFVNAHSHAFQVGLRGTRQFFPRSAGNFWTWRESMYRLAGEITPERCYLLSRQAFAEMLAAGITSVGEFHYLHHDSDSGIPGWEMDEAVLRAARETGIRLCLIHCWYATGGIGQPLRGAQQRFRPGDAASFLAQYAKLAGLLHAGTQSIALSCHSIRAANPGEIRMIRDLSRRDKVPFHIHVEEVDGEVDDCVASYGVRPLRLMLDSGFVDDSFTAIHCTQARSDDLRDFAAAGGTLCLCPITEGNLSDGIADVPALRAAGGRVCFGTDCNLRVSATEELRWMEFVQRLRSKRRGLIVDDSGASATGLIDAGTIHGARSLHLRAGAIAPGMAGDLVTIDLSHPLLAGCAPDGLADALIFGTGNEAISATFVGGECRHSAPQP